MLFTHAPDLLDHLVAAEASHTLGKQLDLLRRLDLLVVDELGYLPMDGRRANLFFHLVAACYTRGSLLITSNVPRLKDKLASRGAPLLEEPRS